ncbi:hypothetical protein [Pontibacillus sp. HMF3514]|uniref:hypothetical protein n=1 Tax=Pontibacillus sp. HMF3514 TaxID=2692425 RepID=UPI0013204F39|nr:hypothetical protein [Pontibacillus sp. HMF3514]QHE53705.1 hypothetical protein GS400_17520 [Pontibacillus sp. HMF3514]
MKKWLKYSLISLVILLLIGTSWFTYTFFIKEYETADENVDNIVDTDFEVELPDTLEGDLLDKNESTDKNVNQSKNESTKNQNSQGNNKETSTRNKEQRDTENDNSKSTNSKTQTKDNNKETKNQTSNKNELTKENDNDDQTVNNSPDESTNSEEESEKTQQDHVTAEDIKNRYRPTFQALQDQALAKLNNLVAYAYSEYKKKKENGEKVSYGYFYKKYKSAAKELEAKTDATFERLYTSLQQDLVENGYSKDEASDVKAYYNQKKDERESRMLSKVLDKF